TFCSPLLPRDLDVLSRAVTYVTCEVRSTRRRAHQVSLYVDLCSEVAVNTTDQIVRCTTVPINELINLYAGTADQPILKRAGDGVRIDWGYAALSVGKKPEPMTSVGLANDVRKEFAQTGKLSGGSLDPQPVKDGWPVMAIAWELGKNDLRDNFSVTRRAMIAYDEDSAVEYLG